MRQVHGLSRDGKTIVLWHFDGGVECDSMQEGDAPKRLLVVDVETTGLDAKVDRMIEFAAAELLYTDDGRIVKHVGTYSWLEDPKLPIPEEITAITGITDADVRGKSIPARAEELLHDADMIVSHNASFDWPFCRRRWQEAVDEKVWACSLRQIDWKAWDFPVHKQELLTRFHGFFYDAHRAEIDVEALVKLLQMRPEPQAPRYLAQLLHYLEDTRYRFVAVGTPYEAKDELKQRGYSWDPERRAWWTTSQASRMEAEQEWLEDLYARYRSRGRPFIQKIDPRQQWA
jgi:DNA polymerase-3 subunit epsilon